MGASVACGEESRARRCAKTWKVRLLLLPCGCHHRRCIVIIQEKKERSDRSGTPPGRLPGANSLSLVGTVLWICIYQLHPGRLSCLALPSPPAATPGPPRPRRAAGVTPTVDGEAAEAVSRRSSSAKPVLAPPLGRLPCFPSPAPGFRNRPFLSHPSLPLEESPGGCGWLMAATNRRPSWDSWVSAGRLSR